MLKENNPLYSDIDVADDWEFCLQDDIDISIEQNKKTNKTVMVPSSIINESDSLEYEEYTAEYLAYLV